MLTLIKIVLEDFTESEKIDLHEDIEVNTNDDILVEDLTAPVKIDLYTDVKLLMLQ